MSTYTAQVLVGHSHLYHGGIKPSHVLFLSENGRSAWCLYPLFLGSFNKDCKSSSHKVWICDPFTFIEDAMLMTGLFVRKDKELLKLAQHFNKKILTAQHVEITEVLSEKQRETLYERSKSISWYPLKISVSVFAGSSIKNISKLEEYKDLEFEVCASFYRRNYNPFSDDFKTTDETKSSDFPLYLERLKSGFFRR